MEDMGEPSPDEAVPEVVGSRVSIARWILAAILADEMAHLDRVHIMILIDRESSAQVHIGPYPTGLAAALAVESEIERNRRAGLTTELSYLIAPLYPPGPSHHADAFGLSFP